MPKKVKKFIDKKNSVTFRLVHRSQQDPLIADERAPQHVLVERNDDRGTSQSLNRAAIEKRKEEQRKYGIFFDDDYDYLQYLKDVREVSFEPVSGFDVAETLRLRAENNGAKLVLPSSVFASNVEEKVGLLNKAAPVSGFQPQLDPDVMAALDSDFEYSGSDSQNSLEDDFVALAQGPCGSSDEEDDDNDEGEDDLAILEGSQFTFDDEETKSRFTNYSMSSSVIRRGNGLTLLDDRFEKMYEDYDEDRIGPLDCDNIEGCIQTGDELLESAIKDYKKNKAKIELSQLRKLCPAKYKNGDEYESGSEDDELEDMVIEEPIKKWDCESVLSTYSSLYNHPKVISTPLKPKPIKVSSKTGLPLNTLAGHGLTASALKTLDDQGTSPSEKSVISVCSMMRARNETPEDRQIRKRAVKEHRRERRIEKKANSLAFKEEKKIQAKMLINIKEQLKGIKL